MSVGTGSEQIIERIAAADTGRVNLMEVCGTHTMSIARSGLKQILPENIRLISGPGCPVCVTPDEVMDAVLDLSLTDSVTIATYGDMIRVPGSRRGVTLRTLAAQGADIRIVYSPMDALEIAASRKDREVVFLGAGFETTAPGTAMAVQVASERKLDNFTVFSMLKTVEPALRALISDPDFNIQGFILPGHVATIIGERGFEFLASEYGIPGVISGFEPEDILVSIYRLVMQIGSGRAEIENEYTRAVAHDGNTLAMAAVNNVFEPADSLWRGLGMIAGSGLKIRDEFSKYDASVRFGLHIEPLGRKSPCRCGDVIRGMITPRECPMFGTNCDPENPAGPCMVSSEGACAAAYRYMI